MIWHVRSRASETPHLPSSTVIRITNGAAAALHYARGSEHLGREWIMQGLQRNRTAWANHRLDSTRLGSTVVAFQPIASASHKSPFRSAGSTALHSPDVGAEILRFQPHRIALAAQPRAGRQAKPAATSLQHSADSDDDYRHRMLINLLTSAWLAALGTAGYFTLSGLVQMH